MYTPNGRLYNYTRWKCTMRGTCEEIQQVERSKSRFLFGRRNRIGRAVACRAVLGSRLVEQNRLGRNNPGRLVTLGAAHILMSAPQRERRPLLMVKQRRLPLRAVVALGAMRNIRNCKLLPMDVVMAVFAGGRRRFEVDVDQPGFEIRRFVAVFAGRRAMGSQQRKLRFRVIEAGDVLPRLG